MSPKKTSTRDLIRLGSLPPGYRLLNEFLLELNGGLIPKTPTTLVLADAFKQILTRGATADKALQLTGKPGRRPHRSAELSASDARQASIVEFIRNHVAADKKKRGSVTRAVAAAASKFHKDSKTIWNAWRERERIDAFVRPSMALAEFNDAVRMATEIAMTEQSIIQQHAATLTPDRRSEFMSLDGQECYRIAIRAFCERLKLLQSK